MEFKIFQQFDPPTLNLRKKYNLAQRELGQLVGVSQNYIHLLEKEVRKPSKTLQLLLTCVEEKLKKEGGE